MTPDLSGFVFFEKRKPQGTEHFYGLLHAIKNHFIIHLRYLKYEDDDFSQRVLEPYSLKEFKGRWYVLAKDQKDERVKTFGLDRIQDLEITKKRFSYPVDFNANELYKNCFGIINPMDAVPEEIILSFNPFQGKYIKSFPLHESQRILIDNETEFRVELKLYSTHDLLMELLSYGDNLNVIQPQSLKEEIKAVAEKILAKYL